MTGSEGKVKVDENDKRFGTAIGTVNGTCRWFNGKPRVVGAEVKTVRERWLCPLEGCSGEMVSTGMMWPTGPGGYHHTCTECGLTAALSGVEYPRIVYE